MLVLSEIFTLVDNVNIGKTDLQSWPEEHTSRIVGALRLKNEMTMASMNTLMYIVVRGSNRCVKPD